MGKENKRRFWVDGLKGGRWWPDPFVFSGPALFLFLMTNSVFAQSVSKTPTITVNLPTGKRPPKPTPVPTSISNQPDVLPDTYMQPRKLRVMGLSSVNAPEKYARKLMFEMSTNELLKKYGWAPNKVCRVDGNENVYLTFQRAVAEFDKNGKLLRVIENISPTSGNNILVDEGGNLFIREYGVENGRVISSIRVFDSNGILITQRDIKNWHVFEGPDVRFSHGNIYSIKTGDVFYKLPNADEKEIGKKKFPKDLKFQLTGASPAQYETDDHDNLLPGRIDGFNFGCVMDIDSSGDIYAEYVQGSPAGEHPVWQLFRLYKFNPKFRLLAGFDFYPDDINLQTGTLYHVENGQMVKWEKPIKP
jgi:hypothetical protein